MQRFRFLKYQEETRTMEVMLALTPDIRIRPVRKLSMGIFFFLQIQLTSRDEWFKAKIVKLLLSNKIKGLMEVDTKIKDSRLVMV